MYCRRYDCKHNHDGNCGFFSFGTIYHIECIELGTMYEPRTPDDSEA